MSELTLYADSSWQSPWVFHVMVALEELGLRYKLEPMPLPIQAERKAEMQTKAIFAKVPLLVHDTFWLTESLAISEYLAERFPPPGHPRILPADPIERARARQLMSFLRTSLFALRDERPTSSVFQRPVTKPLSDRAKADALELVRVAARLIPTGRTSLFDEWCIADADFSLALMRLVASSDSLPHGLLNYALAQWGRTSIRKYLAYIPTTP
jgi:glutathione S-transferase